MVDRRWHLVAGGLAVALAAFIGGVTGFGYSLVATPLLLLIGFSLPFVVTVNMAVAGITRMSVAYRFRARHTVARRRHDRRLHTRALARDAGADDGRRGPIKLVAGLILMGAAVLLWRSVTAPPPRPLPGAPVAAGFAGGFLGAATSLNGVAPVLLLARDKAARAASWPISRSTSSPRTRSGCCS